MIFQPNGRFVCFLTLFVAEQLFFLGWISDFFWYSTNFRKQKILAGAEPVFFLGFHIPSFPAQNGGPRNALG